MSRAPYICACSPASQSSLRAHSPVKMLCKQDAACDTRAGAADSAVVASGCRSTRGPTGCFTLLVPSSLCCSFRRRASQPSPQMLPLIVRRPGECKSTQWGKFRNETRDETGGPWFPPVSLSVFIARIFYAFNFMLTLLLSRALPLRQKRKKKPNNAPTEELILREKDSASHKTCFCVYCCERHISKKKKAK